MERDESTEDGAGIDADTASAEAGAARRPGATAAALAERARREEREAAALRENLRRRKAQTRQRS